jgi:hypothetical protein
MKKSLLIGAVMVAILAVVAPRAFHAFAEKAAEIHSYVQKEDNNKARGDEDYAEKDEIKQSYQLAADAKVDVSGINGRVEIETSSGNTAEIHIVRSARTREALQYRKIIIQQSSTSLVIKGEEEKDNDRSWREKDVRHRVFLKLPRQISLNTSGVNGRVTIGEVDGEVTVSGVNGRVDVAQAIGYSKLSGINGKVAVKIVRLGPRGVDIDGINGPVEIQFTEDINADLNVNGINGQVNTDLANVTVQGKMERENFRAKIGSGGSPIQVSGINGKVTLTRAGSVR